MINFAQIIDYEKELEGTNIQLMEKYITKTKTWLEITSSLLISILNDVYQNYKEYINTEIYSLSIELDEIKNNLIYLYEPYEEKNNEQIRIINSLIVD